MKRTALDGWLNEQIMCGYSYPITRRQAAEEMVAAGGFTWASAIEALCWFRTVRV